MPNAVNVAKCCNVDATLEDTNCVHFRMKDDGSIWGQLQILPTTASTDDKKESTDDKKATS